MSSQNFQTVDLQPQPEKPMGAHLQDASSKGIISEQPVCQHGIPCQPFVSPLISSRLQNSSKMSMQAEPQLSMRGGGVIGDW